VYTQIGVPDPRFIPFYQDNSILIQFMIEEFTQSYRLTLKIKTLIQDQSHQHRVSNFFPSSLIPIFNQLVGSPPKFEGASPSGWSKGHLTKFKEYTEHFSRNSSHENKKHFNLYMSVDQAWVTAIHHLELLNSSYLNSYISHSHSLLCLFPLKRAFHHLQMQFNQILRYIPRIISEYWNNENVIFYLLRKKEWLTEIYGSDFLHKRFKFPMTGSEMIDLLIKSYTSRGFETLLPTIQQLRASEKGGNAH
jgi:hypothetical protein